MSDLIDRQDAKDVVDMELDAIDHVPEWVYDRLLTALDQVPSAQSKVNGVGDLISRQAAIEAIHEDADWLAAQGSDWQVERMERDKSILKSLPSAQPKGKWIITSEFEDCRYVKCDQCKVTQVFYYGKSLTKFCPNCGCRMGEGDSDDER